MWLTPKTWVTGETVTSSMMNGIRDNFLELWKGVNVGDMEYYTSSTAKTTLPAGVNGSRLATIGGIPTWKREIGFSAAPGTVNLTHNILTDLTITDAQEELDTDSFHSGTTATISFPFTGVYFVSFKGYFAGGAADTERGIFLLDNGTSSVILGQTYTPGNTEGFHFSMTGSVYISTTPTYVKFAARQKTGSTLSLSSTRVMITKM